MKSYRGLFKLSCSKKCKKVNECQASCINCPDVLFNLIDLNGKVVATRVKKTKKKEK